MLRSKGSETVAIPNTSRKRSILVERDRQGIDGALPLDGTSTEPEYTDFGTDLQSSHFAMYCRTLPTHLRLLKFQRPLSTTHALLKDPWLLPNTPAHEASTRSPDLPPLPPLPRTNESLDQMRARLVYQSRKRGTLESDLLLSTFAREELGRMSESEMREYDKVCLSHFSIPILVGLINFNALATRRGRLGYLLLGYAKEAFT